MSSVQAQSVNDSLEYRIRPHPLKTGDVALTVANFNYLRNYEFFNKFQDGYTLYGTQLEPQLVYYAHPNLLLSAGIHLRKDFGNEGIYKTYPLFSIKYQKGNTALINGVLEGNIQHRYIEPLVDFEKKITEPVEYGTQVVIQNSKLFFDGWINWKKMIYKPSGEQEQILAGISSDISLFRNNKLKLSVPLQLLVFHQGGQIDTTAKPLQTLLNSAAGFKINYKLSGFFKSIETENYISTFTELSPTKQFPFSKGKGVYLNAGVDSRYGRLTASYWKGTNFFSRQGMPVFQSISQQINNEGHSEKNRQLLFLRYVFQKNLVPHLYFDFRVEPVIDLGKNSSKSIEFYHSLFLVYRQEFKLFSTK
ncbi:hypothetical protein [Rubrolithibacter danxiaensis]|uniref:hypothetical protein n=1 Tax=Rubrolithibacter danxiaensis TaxID=3390805 RepID=UPI003BF8C816